MRPLKSQTTKHPSKPKTRSITTAPPIGIVGATSDRKPKAQTTSGRSRDVTPILFSNRSRPTTWVQSKHPWIRHYSIYYIFNLLTNAFILSFYAVLVYADHISCRTQSGYNVTDHFDLLFALGIVVLSVDALNSAIPCIYFRAKMQMQERRGYV